MTASASDRKFTNYATSQADEDSFDLKALRTGKRCGTIASVANLAKGALGGGVLSGHVAYMKSGYVSAMFLNLGFGVYMGLCYYLLVQCAQILCRRCHVGYMTYPDLAEAALSLSNSRKINKFAGCYRHYIEFIICLHLYGSCACYQLIIAKTIKQLVENTDKSDVAGLDGMPNLRVYVAIMIIPIIMICWITQLKYLAPFSIVANAVVGCCVIMAIYYARVNNPHFENMSTYNGLYNQAIYTGMGVFSMSCAGVILPVENNMENPKRIGFVMVVGYIFIIGCVFCCSFFGYVGYLENCRSPITINFPMTTFPKILKGGIAAMIYVTHALNFYMPFHTCFVYLKRNHKEEHWYKWELIYRALIVSLVSCIAIIFPSIDALMGFLGCFCLTNMTFIGPNFIYMVLVWERPGLGKFKWRLLRAIVFTGIGLTVLICGSAVSSMEMAAPASARKYTNYATSQADEDAFDLSAIRTGKRCGTIASVANMAKGALGGGVLSGHVAYMKSGYVSAIFLNFGFGVYLALCFYLLVKSAQILCRRCHKGYMTYPDLAEAALSLSNNRKINKISGCYRHFIEFVICLNLYGSCACYQLIIAKTIKQLVEDTDRSDVAGLNGMPDLRVYVAIMIIPTILICLITELKYLAPFSIMANAFVGFCIIMAIYYAVENNPHFENMSAYNGLYNQAIYTGMGVFSMSCAGVILPVENNMENPKNIGRVMVVGYIIIIGSVFCCSFFGYVGYLENCRSPITINFPMTTFPKILKGCIGVMIYVTHALNFYMPFQTCFVYLKRNHKEEDWYKWELIYRTLINLVISFVAIVFPSIDALMGFLGCFCIANMAFIGPNFIYMLVVWERPGLGKFNWRLWRAIVFAGIGICILLCGSAVSSVEMVNTFIDT